MTVEFVSLSKSILANVETSVQLAFNLVDGWENAFSPDGGKQLAELENLLRKRWSATLQDFQAIEPEFRAAIVPTSPIVTYGGYVGQTWHHIAVGIPGELCRELSTIFRGTMENTLPAMNLEQRKELADSPILRQIASLHIGMFEQGLQREQTIFTPKSPPGYANFERDRFIYESRKAGATWGEIETGVNKKSLGYCPTESGLRFAAKSYAEKMGLPELPDGEPGRKPISRKMRESK